MQIYGDLVIKNERSTKNHSFNKLGKTPSLALYTYIQPQSFLGSGVEDFYVLPYTGKVKCDHLKMLSIPLQQQVPHEICWKLSQQYQSLTFFLYMYLYIVPGTGAYKLDWITVTEGGLLLQL